MGSWRFHGWVASGDAWLSNYVERQTSQTVVYPSSLYERNLATEVITKH